MANYPVKLGRLDPLLLLEKVGRGEFAVIQLAKIQGTSPSVLDQCGRPERHSGNN